MPTPLAEDVARIGRIASIHKILEVVAQTTGMGFAAVARVTDTGWTACAVRDTIGFGLAPGEGLEVQSTICNEIRQHRLPVVISRASAHPHFSTHPTPSKYGFESYISVPIFVEGGTFFGTLCAIDPKPANLDEPHVLRSFELFAELIAAHLDTELRLERSSQALLDAQDVAKLREQFIAVLGHDLRNPLQAIRTGTAMLKKAPLDAMWQAQVDRMQRSCDRMVELIDNVLDFARGRLGGGLPISACADAHLAEELHHLVAEVQAAHPHAVIETDIRITRAIVCDRRRIAQLLGNLLVNAITHGDARQPVRVHAREDGQQFEIGVHNRGNVIPAERRARLFEPFKRPAPDDVAEGLGLGLYIAAEIARGHAGTLDVTSDAGTGTCFMLRMPVA